MVASPATSEASSIPATSRPPHSATRAAAEVFAFVIHGNPRSYAATSASVAANDIWKLGWTTDCGAMISTANAAIASVLNVKAGLSAITPISTIAVMMKARCVATSAPDKSR